MRRGQIKHFSFFSTNWVISAIFWKLNCAMILSNLLVNKHNRKGLYYCPSPSEGALSTLLKNDEMEAMWFLSKIPFTPPLELEEGHFKHDLALWFCSIKRFYFVQAKARRKLLESASCLVLKALVHFHQHPKV